MKDSIIRRCRVKGQRSGCSAPYPLILGSLLILLFSFLILSLPLPAAWFGLENCSSHWAVATGYADGCRFQAPEGGTSSRLEIRAWSSGGSKATFRMAVYDDDNGRPDSRLWEGTDIAYQGGEWCGENVNTIQLTEDAYYWFAFKTSEAEEMCYVGGGPTYSHEWKAGQVYADTFPNPWGGYTGRNSNRYTMRMHYVTGKGTKGIIEIDPGLMEGGFVR